MMKKRIISIVVLLVFLLVGFVYFNKVFSTTHYYVNTSEDFKTLAKKTNIDLIFYGSSHVYTEYNPLIFNKVDNVISYNLGSDALRTTVTDLVLQESLKYTKPKLVILEVYRHSIVFPVTESGKGFQLRALDFISNYSLLKLKKVRSIYNSKEYLGVYFPLFRNHNNWNDYNYVNLSRRSVFNMDENFYYNGFLGSTAIIDSEEKEKYKDFRNKKIYIDSSAAVINERAKDDIRNFVSIAKKAGSKVLIITSPDPRMKYWNYYFFGQMNKFCKSLNVPYLNLNEYYDEMDLKITDFKDNSHLNTNGSIKASTFLAKYLKRNYSFADRSSEEIYKQQTNLYDAFIENNKPYMSIRYDKVVAKALLNNLSVKDVNVLKEQKDKLFFDINLEGNLEKPLSIENYVLAVHVFPKKSDLDLMNDKSKARKRNYEVHEYLLTKDSKNIQVEFDSKIKNIDKLELFLYDKSGFVGVVGNKIIIDGLKSNTIN